MDYKKIIPSQDLRLKILKLTDFLPDELMVKLQYRIATGTKINFRNPKKYSEKIQLYKLFYRNPLMTQCSDKFGVREYVKSKGLEDILVPLYQVYDSVEEIDFDKLPSRFVLKITNGSHTNILCEDKSKLDIIRTKELLNKWLKNWSGKVGREWSYYNIKPRIICEKYLEKDKNNDIIDYKFLCFDGKPLYLYVITDRFLEDGIKLGIYDMNFNKLPYRRSDIRDMDKEVKKPESFDTMKDIARILSEDFPHVRVDLYNIDGKIYFGELTFYDASGYKDYIPNEFNTILGDKFTRPMG